jgi:hypothetical protein
VTSVARPVITEPGLYPDIDEDVRRVPVGHDHFALIDAADYPLVAYFNWYLLRGHNGKLYAYTNGAIYMHRLIAGTPAGCETDHENGDGLDNRRVNLRPATRSQNKGNMGKPRRPDGSAHTSQYKGVIWDKARSKWLAKICRHGVTKNLGRYDDEADAARAYDAAAAEHFGEFARLNFPEVTAWAS